MFARQGPRGRRASQARRRPGKAPSTWRAARKHPPAEGEREAVSVDDGTGEVASARRPPSAVTAGISRHAKARGTSGEKSEEAIVRGSIETTPRDGREGPLLQSRPARRSVLGQARRGPPPPQTAHDNSSADATGRPRGAGTAGSPRCMTASSGLLSWGGPGQRSAPRAAGAGALA
jgi:hypothetical protein